MAQIDFEPEATDPIDFQPDSPATPKQSLVTPPAPPLPPEYAPGYPIQKRDLGQWTGGPFSPELPQQLQEAAGTIAGPFRAAQAGLAGITGDVSEMAADFLRRTGIDPAATPGQPILNIPRVPIVPPLDILAPKVGKAIEEKAGQFVSGFTEPGQAAMLPFAGLKPVQALFGAQSALAVPESIQQIYQARNAPEAAGATTEAAANLLMAGLIGKHLVGEVPPPAMGRSPYAQAVRRDQEVGTETGQEPQGSQADRGGDLEQAAPEPAQSLETRKEEGRPEVLLLNQALENNRSLGIGHKLEVVPNFGPADPNHLRVFQAEPPGPDGTPGTIRMNQAAFDRWIKTVPKDKVHEAINSALAEEGIHATVTPQQALEFLKTLTPAEIALGRRLYLGDRAAEVQLTPEQLGHELLRQRMQRLLRMKPTELAEVAGRERWSRASLEFISRMIGKVRSLLRTDAAKAGEKTVNDLLNTYQRNIASLTGETLTAAAYRDPATGQVYNGPHHPAIMKGLGLEGYETRESRNTPDFGYSTNLRPFVSRTEAAGIAEASGQKMEAFDVNDQEQPQPHSNEISQPTDPEAPLSEQESASTGAEPFLIRRREDLPPLPPGERVVTVEKQDGTRYPAVFRDKYWDLSFQGRGKVPSIGTAVNNAWSHGILPPGDKIVEDNGDSAFQQAQERSQQPAMVRRKKADQEHPELFLPPATAGEARPGAEMGLKPATADNVAREAYGHLTQSTDTATEQHARGAKPDAPSFAEFSNQLQASFGEMNPGALADAWGKAVWTRLQNASGQTLSALRAALDLRHKLGTRDIPDPMHTAAEPQTLSVPRGTFPEFAEEAKAQREGVKEARQMRISAERYRNNAIAQIGEKLIRQSVRAYNLTRKEITPEEVALGRKSLRPAVNPITAAERSNPALGNILTDDAREMGLPVSATRRLTVLQNRATRKVEMVSTYRDPRRGAVLMDPDSPGRTHSPLGSILKRWRPVLSLLVDEPVKNFRQSYASLGEFEDQFGNAARKRSETETGLEPPPTETEAETRPGAWSSQVPMTEPEARSILDKVFEEVGTIESPEDVKLALQGLKETGAADRIAISGFRKLAARIEAQNPNLDAEGLLNKLAQTIYDNHKAASSTEDFQRRTMESGPAPSSQAPGAVPQAAVIAARAREAKTQAIIQRALQGSEPDALDLAGATSAADLENVPAMIRRTAQAAAEEVKLVYEDVADIIKAGSVAHRVSATLDAADNTANNTARRAEFGIRLQSVYRPGSLLKRWLTPWMHGNPDVLAAANPIVEAGGVLPGGKINVAGVLAKIPVFKAKVASARVKAAAMAQDPSFRVRRIGKAWLRACDQLDRELDYAAAHINDPELQLTASRVKHALDAQYDLETSAGYQLEKDPSYLPHRYDAELWSGRSVVFQRSKILGKKFRERQSFPTHYDAIEAGPYLPVTRDAASLVSHRIRQGTQMMLRDAWKNSLLKVTLPNGKPLAVKPVRMSASKWGSPSTAYVAVAQGGGAAPPLIVHEDFAPLISNLTGRNFTQDWMLTRGALNLAQGLKHTLLIGDFFHLGRVVYYAAGIMGRPPSFQRGWSVLELNPRDVPDAIQRGVIRPQDAAWANEPVQFGNRTINRRVLAGMFESEGGLNIGKIQDALYKDLITRLSPTSGPLRRAFVAVTDPSVGRYNRFLFDRLSRGLMIESAVREFEKQSEANPKADPRALMNDISRDTNIFFGNIGRQGWLKGAWQQDLARLLLLAPQWVEGLIKKESIAYTRFGGAAARGLGAPYRQGLPALGTIGSGIGRGLAAMFLLTQGINLVTRRKPTWENPEKEHKFDAFIPGFGAESSGFWLSPFALFNEITHDVYRLVQDKPKWTDAFDQIAGNKESPLLRAAMVAATGRSPTGTYLTTSGSHIATTLEQLTPAPITFSRYLRAAGHAVAPGMISGNLPGQLQRQVFSTFGLKVEPAKSPLQEAQRLARDFADSQNHFDPIHVEDTDQPAYSRLRSAVRAGDERGTWKVLDQLRKQGKTDAQILKAMHAWMDRGYTWSREAESQFRYSLTPEQREVLAEATYQKMREYNAFLRMYQNEPPTK